MLKYSGDTWKPAARGKPIYDQYIEDFYVDASGGIQGVLSGTLFGYR